VNRDDLMDKDFEYDITEGYVNLRDVNPTCPQCGNKNTATMICFSRQWVQLSSGSQCIGVEITPSMTGDVCQCELCNHRTTLQRFILAGAGKWNGKLDFAVKKKTIADNIGGKT